MFIELPYGGGELSIGSFANGRPCLLVGDARVTVNVPDAVWPPVKDDVLVKDYGECQGALAVLVAAGVVAPPHAVVESGFVELPVCKLLLRADSN